METLGNTAAKSASQLVSLYAAHIKSKTVLTTGVSPGGLGAFFVEAIAKAQPALLILAGRNPAKVEQTAAAITKENPEVKVHILQLDLGSLAAVRKAAETVNGWGDIDHIDVVVNNAGIMGVDYSKTVDGFENHFATNHLAHFLFTNLIMGKILASQSPRVVNISSNGHRLSPIRFGDYNFHVGETYNKWLGYGQSKTANALFPVALAGKLGSKKLLAFSSHPGVINTNLSNHLDWQNVEWQAMQAVDRYFGNAEGWMTSFKYSTPDEGVATHVYAAFDPEIAGHNGAYLDNCQVANPYTQTIKPWATDPVEADKLWTLSEQLVGQKFAY